MIGCPILRSQMPVSHICFLYPALGPNTFAGPVYWSIAVLGVPNYVTLGHLSRHFCTILYWLFKLSEYITVIIVCDILKDFRLKKLIPQWFTVRLSCTGCTLLSLSSVPRRGCYSNSGAADPLQEVQRSPRGIV